MPSIPPRYRDALLVLVAVVLLAAPLWVPAFHLGDTAYRYESVRIETSGTEMAFATDPGEPDVGISERIACAEGMWSRSCAFERYVAENNTVPTQVYTGNPDYLHTDANFERYDYVYLNGTVYEAIYPANQSVTREGAARLELGLQPVAAADALQRVSVPVQEVPPPIREAARTGVAYGHERVAPPTPVELDDGTYRRVYLTNVTAPPAYEGGTETLLTVGGPVVGLGLLGWLRTRYEVSLRVRRVGDE